VKLRLNICQFILELYLIGEEKNIILNLKKKKSLKKKKKFNDVFSWFRIGTPQTPLLKLNEVKKAYLNRDMYEWIQFWNQVGNKFQFHHPDVFPIRSVNASRIFLLEPKTLDCIRK
jgi:hypothetical protein